MGLGMDLGPKDGMRPAGNRGAAFKACNASQSVFPSLVGRYHLLPRAQAYLGT